ncbi:hypothetical protein [Paraflavitalea sp. CAU 1676]|uniref:hypothetical protein n=1 Tax=Paraflavitalea sp. CAU 1676 TaxID=3032598 RepID=UPI0023DA2710|nr:hypothetical protein [Paraflavitalea sp. CAU 1676]MDF2188418.1 hypothetical protein [Paraflavitalea sp. CAU 1676]
MTHAANIPELDGNLVVPVFTEQGTLLACLLPAHSLDMHSSFPLIEALFRQCAGNMQAINKFSDMHRESSPYERTLHTPAIHTDVHSWAGQLLQSLKKQIKMANEQQKGVASDRILTDPAFERTRENMSEFGRSGKAASLLREIFRDMTVYAKDQVLQSRLLKFFSQIISTDGINKRGERTIANGDPSLLKGFNFNQRTGIRDSLYAKCPVSINRTTGVAQVTIPSFVPNIMVKAPRGTTHYRIVAGATAVNFDTELYSYMRTDTGELPWGQLPTTASNLLLNFPANSPDTVIVALSIEFGQQVNGHSYPLKTTSANATTIVAVDKLVLPG